MCVQDVFKCGGKTKITKEVLDSLNEKLKSLHWSIEATPEEEERALTSSYLPQHSHPALLKALSATEKALTNAEACSKSVNASTPQGIRAKSTLDKHRQARITYLPHSPHSPPAAIEKLSVTHTFFHSVVTGVFIRCLSFFHGCSWIVYNTFIDFLTNPPWPKEKKRWNLWKTMTMS